jgi:hypothetical protein
MAELPTLHAWIDRPASGRFGLAGSAGAPPRAPAAELGSTNGITRPTRLERSWAVLAAAGDVNGDGYTDLIAGAPYFDNGQNDEARSCSI